MLANPALFDLEARAHTRELFDNAAAPRARLPRFLPTLRHRRNTKGPSARPGASPMAGVSVR